MATLAAAATSPRIQAPTDAGAGELAQKLEGVQITAKKSGSDDKESRRQGNDLPRRQGPVDIGDEAGTRDTSCTDNKVDLTGQPEADGDSSPTRRGGSPRGGSPKQELREEEEAGGTRGDGPTMPEKKKKKEPAGHAANNGDRDVEKKDANNKDVDNKDGGQEKDAAPNEKRVPITCSSSTRGVEELSLEDETPWENRLCECADRDGETVVTLGPLPASEVEGYLEKIAQVAAMVECDATLIHTTERPPAKEAAAAKQQSVAKGSAAAKAEKDGDDQAQGKLAASAVATAPECDGLRTAHVLVRKRPSEGHHLDLRVAVVGNVDAGKSTLVGVMTGPTTFLDDGRGLARSRVLRHKHEAETGRTSSIAEDQHMRLNTKGASLATERHAKASTAQDVVETAKVVSFIDLAGHERYLRTTVYGLTAHEPDYVMVVVGANHGITRMTKEHVGMAIALNVPLFVVVTKVDLCPEPVMKETMKQLTRLLKLPGAKKQPYTVRNTDELMHAARGFGKSAITPIFCISSVDGTNVPLLRQFFNLMPSRRSWQNTDTLPAEFLIDQYFNVVGVGLVVAGTLLSGTVGLNHALLMGPDYQGKFNAVTVKSIHHMRTAVPALLPGQTGAFVVRSRTKEHVRQFGIRKGMVLLEPSLSPVATKRFTCDVLVLHSQTTMRVNYQPILYARNVRQCVRIVEMDKDVLRTGVRARVTFEFMYRSEFLQKDTKVLFTEGKTKAIGTIRDLLE